MSKKQVVEYSVGDKVQFESKGYIGYLNSQTLVMGGWATRVYTIRFAKKFRYTLADENGVVTFSNVEHILLKPFITSILDVQTQIDILSYEYHDLLYDIDIANDIIHDLAYDLYLNRLHNNKTLIMMDALSESIDLANADIADDIYGLVNIILNQRHVISLLTKDNLDLIQQIEGGSGDNASTDRISKRTDITIQIDNS